MGQEQQDFKFGTIDWDTAKSHLSNLNQKPFLLINKHELNKIKSNLNKNGYKELFDKVMEVAASNVDSATSPLAAPADVDPRLFQIGWQLLGMENILPAIGVCWHLTGDRKFIEIAVEHLNTALSWKKWSDGRHEAVDGNYNASPETASGMRAFCYAIDFLEDELHQDLVRACKKKIALYAQRLIEISKSQSTRWAKIANDDWSCDIHSAVGMTALLLYNFDDRAIEWLKHSIKKILEYLECIPNDGGHPSGVSRWEYALTHCCFFIEALFNCTEIDLRNHPAIVKTSKFAVRCLSPMGRDIIQIDQGLPLNVSNPVSGPLSKLLAKWYKDPLLGWGIFNTLEDSYTQAFDLIWYDPTLPVSSPEVENEKSIVFEDIGWVVMRSGWKENDNMVAFQCTPYWPGYHHLDQCTYQIFAHGKEIVLDSGLGWRAHPNYFDRYRDSVAHNVVLIDGEGQLKHTSESGCKMLKTELSDFADYASGDGTNAYDKAQKFIRSILFLKPNLVVIRDQIELDKPRPIEWLMHGNGCFEMHLLGADRGFTLINEDTKLEGFILFPERWAHNQKRGYKLTDWQTRHEVTHPVLGLIPDKSVNYDFLIVLEIDNIDKQRMIPGGIADDGTLSLVTSNYQCTIKPSDIGFDYTIYPF